MTLLESFRESIGWARGGAVGDPERARDRAAWLACTLVTFAAFAFTLRNGFAVTWDDGIYIVDNEHVRELSLTSIGWSITAVYHLWAPLTWISFAVDHAIWGLNPVGYHLTNTLCHAIDAGLAFWLGSELLEASGLGLTRRALRMTALAAALGWALHPLRVESVAWVAERKDVLGALFGFPAVVAYLRYARGSARPFWRSKAYWAALATFSLSLCAKSSLVTLPLVLLLLDAYPLRRFGPGTVRDLVVEKLPWLLPSAVVSAMTLAAHQGAGMTLGEVDVTSRLLIAARSTWEYVGFMLWPAGLSPFYLHPLRVSALAPSYLLSAAGVLIVTGVLALRARRWPAVAAAWLAYLGLLVPGLAATQVSDTAMGDRFTYFPSFPLTLLAAAGVALLVAKLASRAGRVLIAGGAASLVALWGGLTLRQISFWRDDVSLWTRAIDVKPHFSGRMYFQRASAYELQKDWGSAVRDMDEAISIAAAKGYGRMQDLFMKRARIRSKGGDLQGAVEDYGRAIDTDPMTPAQFALHKERAALYLRLGKEDLAAEDLRFGTEGGVEPPSMP